MFRAYSIETPDRSHKTEPVASSGTDPLDVWANLRIPVVTDFLAIVVRHTTGDEFLLTTSSEGLIVYTVGASAITVGSLYIAPAYCASASTYFVYGALASSIQYLAINALGNAINDAHSDSTIYGTAESAVFGGLLSMFGRLFRGGCFVADTPVTVSEWPSLVELRNSYDSTRSWSGESSSSGTLVQRKVPIESLSIGSRVPTKNPNRWEIDPQAEPDPATWTKLSITVQRSDGGVVDAELIRPRSWMEAYDLRAGRTIPLNLPELEVSGVATITAISACPPIATGEGSVITGRVMTRQVHEVTHVDILGADGTAESITGTSIHPVWSVDRQDWIPLAELEEGETLQGIDGPAIVLSVSLSRVSQPVYNIEVHNEHVYQVGELGVVVHNTCFDDAPKSMHVGDAGHHVPAVRKSRGRPFEVERSDLSRPTIHVIGDEAAVGQAHWRMHNAERTHIGPRQGDFVGTDAELFEAYRKSYRDLHDIRVDVGSPDGSTILGRNVTLEEAVNLLESFLGGKK